MIIDRKNPNEDDEDMTIREENAGFKTNAISQEGKGKFTKETLKEESENLVISAYFIRLFAKTRGKRRTAPRTPRKNLRRRAKAL